MGFTPTVYRWDDAGAPSIGTRKPSEIINILKKCLVDGYGTKPGAGWTAPFEDASANSIVLRNSTEHGSGGFVKIWAKTAGNIANDTLFMINAPFIDSINPDWSTTLGVSYRDFFFPSNGYINRWAIYATPLSFYFVCWGSAAGYNVVAGTTATMPNIFIGDYESFVPGDVNRFIALSSQSLTADVPLTSNGGGSALFMINFGSVLGRLYETASFTNPKLFCLQQVTPFNNGYETTKVTNTPPLNFNMCFSPIFVALTSTYINATSTAVQYLDSAGNNTCRSMLHPIMRGKLPGLHISLFFGCANELNIYTWQADGITWHLMPQYHFGGSRVWLSTGEWYA